MLATCWPRPAPLSPLRLEFGDLHRDARRASTMYVCMHGGPTMAHNVRRTCTPPAASASPLHLTRSPKCMRAAAAAATVWTRQSRIRLRLQVALALAQAAAGGVSRSSACHATSLGPHVLSTAVPALLLGHALRATSRHNARGVGCIHASAQTKAAYACMQDSRKGTAINKLSAMRCTMCGLPCTYTHPCKQQRMAHPFQQRAYAGKAFIQPPPYYA